MPTTCRSGAARSGFFRSYHSWIHVRTSDERFELFEGDAFEIGDARGKVLRIEEREAEIEFDGQRYVVALGDNLRNSAPVRD